MTAQNKSTEGYNSVALGSLTTTGANESARVSPVTGASGPLLQSKFLSSIFTPNEVWVPIGISYIITTGITVTNAVVTLTKNGVAAATGGTATLPIAALGANYIFAAFTPWTFTAADAAGDLWSVKVSTTSTAGVVNPVLLWYSVRQVAGVSDGIAF